MSELTIAQTPEMQLAIIDGDAVLMQKRPLDFAVMLWDDPVAAFENQDGQVVVCYDVAKMPVIATEDDIEDADDDIDIDADEADHGQPLNEKNTKTSAQLADELLQELTEHPIDICEELGLDHPLEEPYNARAIGDELPLVLAALAEFMREEYLPQIAHEYNVSLALPALGGFQPDHFELYSIDSLPEMSCSGPGESLLHETYIRSLADPDRALINVVFSAEDSARLLAVLAQQTK